MTKPVNEREIVLAVLMEVTENGRHSHIVLKEVLDKYQYMEKRERSFITRVTEGTLEHLIEIDYILDQFSKVKVKKMKPVIRNLLRSAVYQLKYMDRIPDRAVCSESVRLAVKKGFSGLKGYVNGVLRNIARELDQVEYPKEPTAALSVRYSCPEWIVRMWRDQYGDEVTETMLRDFQEEKPTAVRCCLNRISPEELKIRLENEGVHVQRHPYLPYGFEISGYDYLERLESFREGLFTVQDVSSMLVGEAADPKARDLVIDVCAAPGGKALHAAEKIFMKEKGAEAAAPGDSAAKESGSATEEDGVVPEEVGSAPGHVEARDLTEYKVDLIRENISRSGLTNISAACMDASVPDRESFGKADIVIADLPCSGLGVMGRKPELRYRASKESVESLSKLQREILSCVQNYVKPGGTLIYSTCTVTREENMDNVQWFLREYPEFTFDDIGEKLCPELKKSMTEKGCIQLLPGVHKTDGFFIARFRRSTQP